MSVLSINTNGAALNALQNLNRTTSDLNETQLRINTGLQVKTAKDNAAVFAIAQNLRADKRGLDAVKNSLDRARSVLDVTTAAAESIQDVLIQIKEKVVAASDKGLDQRSRDALKQDFERLREQISLIASNATFNGTNLIDGPTDAANGKPANLVALVSPDATRQISVPRQDLGLYTLKPTAAALPTALVADTGAVTEDNATNTVTGNVFTNDTAAAGNVVGTINGQEANVNNAIRTTYGWLRVQSDGSYTYTLDNSRAETQALAAPATVNEVFTYQAQRADGTLSAATNITITITAAGTGVGEAAPATPQSPLPRPIRPGPSSS
ncbi:VCBS domain-containing protein [Hankyongella ginsenosidimutans]|uniref:flagellin N-terminal helical domain-containing protein n=1 Tax=Hankyongella ginsenosidimutans TaxID=1763828 RepID=UPI001CA34BE1|nr:VCBS domain-containing protein [Hankyongella ginsenosidimutans]